MNTGRFLAGLAMALGALACQSRSPSGPSTNPPPASTTVLLDGEVKNALGDQAPLADVSLTASGLAPVLTDATGRFRLEAAVASMYQVNLTRPGFVERKTRGRIPGHALLSMIPSSFSLDAFEEFAPRKTGLRKWQTDPSLLLLANAIDYQTAQAGFTEFVVTDRRVAQLALDCTMSTINSSLVDMSGGRLSFTQATIIEADAGSRIELAGIELNQIIVVFARNLGANGRGIAYSERNQWVFDRGVVFLHADDLPPCSMTAARVIPHEMGHALGYAWNHVTKTPSMMGSPPFPMTQFDRDAIRVIYSRPPGNLGPDVDPGEFSFNVSPGAIPSKGREPVP